MPIRVAATGMLIRVKHYITAFSNDAVKLDREVNDLLAKGYQPYGSPYISDHQVGLGPDRLLVCQAMVLYDNDEPAGLGSSVSV